MRPLLTSVCVFTITLLPAITLANGPPPPLALRYLREPDKKVKDEGKKFDPREAWSVNRQVKVSYRSDLERPRMLIPRHLVANIKAAEPAKKADADGPGGRNLFAGLALSAAFISGGFWLVRRSGKAGAMLAVVAILGALVFVSSLSGNAGPPWRFPPQKLEIKDDQSATLGMDMYILDEGNLIEIVLPKELLPVKMLPREVLRGE